MGGWVAEVNCGIVAEGKLVYRIETGEHHPKTNKGEKAGRAAAARQAVKELQPMVASTLAKKPVALEDVFQGSRSLKILESCPSAWSKFWKAMQSLEGSDRAVGVGTEGNNTSGPPVLVQVAARHGVIIELPRARTDGQLSPDMQRLLADNTITKVFSRKAMGLYTAVTAPGVVHLEGLPLNGSARLLACAAWQQSLGCC